MIVTNLVEVNKSRTKVYIDNEFAFVLYKGELRLYHIKEGAPVLKEDYEKILSEVLPKRAKLRAMNLLMKKEYTVQELRKKLQNGDYPDNIIDEAVEYVSSFRYIDDLRYATDYITAHEASRSRRRIEQDLINKGIARTTLEQAWGNWQNNGGSQDEEAMIAVLLDKRHYNPEKADIKERQKTYAFLMRKGFSPDSIRKTMKAQYDDACYNDAFLE
jgi:regulatory protein